VAVEADSADGGLTYCVRSGGSDDARRRPRDAPCAGRCVSASVGRRPQRVVDARRPFAWRGDPWIPILGDDGDGG